MNDCEEIRPTLTVLLDGELPPEAAARVEAHLARCAACAGTLAEYRVLRKAARAASAPEPVDLWARIAGEIAPAPEAALMDELRALRREVGDELRALRREVQTLREETAALRRELARRPADSRSTALSLPDAPGRSFKPYRLV